MRKTLAIVALLCGAVGADAFPADNVPYCSEGFTSPARLSITDDGASFTLGKKVEHLTAHEPLDGIDGVAYDGGDAIIALKIGKDEVVIFRDRVFWPCP